MSGRSALRRGARATGELALLWLAAAGSTAAFAPRTAGLNAQDHFAVMPTGVGSGLMVAVPAVVLCGGLWWLLRNGLLGPLALGAAAVLAAALLLPHGLNFYFLPPPLVLLAVTWVLWRHPESGGRSG